MPVHGIRLDAEFAALVLTGLAASFYATGEIISNIFLTFLLGTLFFLMGLNLDIGRVRKNLHRRKEVTIGTAMVYLVVPLLALSLSQVMPGGLSDAFIALAVSTAAIGSPVVWSNIGKGEGDTAHVISGFSVIAGVAAIPVLLAVSEFTSVFAGFSAGNLLIAGVPLMAGVFAQRFQRFLFDDFKHHFSKLAVWLLALVAGVQFHLTLNSAGQAFITHLWLGMFVMAGFVLTVFFAAYKFSKSIGVMERKARAIGFVSSSKELAVALFIAVQISSQAVLYIALYYFIRQAVCGAIAEYFSYGSSPTLDRFKAGFKM